MTWNGITAVALTERDGGCKVPLPTGRYPLYTTTLLVDLDANGEGTVELQADRDYLFTELTIEGGTRSGPSATVDMIYCNTRYLDASSLRNWRACCDRKPRFLVGVRDTKKLTFIVRGGDSEGKARITLSGFQGAGCCG